MLKNKEKYLFIFDLDGTLLKDSGKGLMNKKDVEAINKLRKMGHIVCIATGRPWRSTKKTYDQLGLDTIVANYNGAQIHNPSDYSFVHNISYMDLNDVLYILGDKVVKKEISNVAIEGPSWVMIDKRDKDLEKVFGFSNAQNLKVGMNIHRLPLRPTGVIMDVKTTTNITKLGEYLKRTYGDLGEFSWWSKGEGLTPVFDMTNVGVNKSKAVSLMCRYYNIPIDRTISFGDGYNDVPMFSITEMSVAMANASNDVKSFATYVTKKTNKEGGIAEFIERFLGDKSKDFIKEQKKIRKQKYVFGSKTTKAH